MPGGFLEKFGTASCGIVATLVTVALVWAGRGVPVTASATATASPLRISFFIDFPSTVLGLWWPKTSRAEAPLREGGRTKVYSIDGPVRAQILLASPLGSA